MQRFFFNIAHRTVGALLPFIIIINKNYVLTECCNAINFKGGQLSAEMDDDVAQLLILREGCEYTQLFNQFLIIKYLWDFVSIEVNINKHEHLLLAHNKQILKRSEHVFIFTNLEKILNPLINEYTRARYNLLYLEIPHLAIPLSAVHFHCQIPRDLLATLVLERTSRISPKTTTQALSVAEQEVQEDVNLNIKVTTIHRCSLLQITNNARKISKTGLAAKVPFTCGSTLIVDNVLFKKLNKMLLTSKLPHSKAQKLTFRENGSLAHLYDNLNFSYKIWITKFKNKIDPNFLNDDSLKKHSFDISSLTCIINHLNNVSLHINSSLFLEFKKLIEASDSYKKILLHHTCTKTTKLIHTILDDNIEATSDESLEFSTLNTKDTNNYLEYTLISSQLDKLLKYANGAFFLKYVLDGRSRVYVHQWPINYQLSHFVRNILELAKMDDNWVIYKKFFESPEYVQYKDVYNLWKIHTIDYTKAQSLLNVHEANINLAEIALLKPNCSQSLKKLLLAESLLNTLASLAPNSYVTFQSRIDYAADWLHQRASLDEFLTEKKRFVDSIFNKDDFSQIKKIITLKNIIKDKKLTDLWWADASSNALQLIVLTRGTNSRLLLQLLNLIDNTTEHKNIYSYIAHQLRALNYKHLVSTEDTPLLQLIDIKLAKYIAMPAAYGKTLWSCKKTIKKSLATKSKWWTTLSNSTQDKLCFLWYTGTFKVLAELGLDLKDHIQRCKKEFDASSPVYSHFKIPIFTRTIKVFNRTTTLRKLKAKKQHLAELLQSIHSIENLSDLTDNQLELKLTQEIKQLSADAENTYNLYQARKILIAIQTQKKILAESNACTRRVNVIIRKTTRIQFRVARLNSSLIDLQRSNTAIAPNITHAYDAAILLSTIEKLGTLQIPCACIHDSIGCRLEHLPIVIYLYKHSLISTVEKYYSQKTRYFPYSTTEPYELADISFPKELLNSSNLFY